MRAEFTREVILEVSARLFRAHGYSATTLRQIAKAAKIKAGSVYYHFKSKDDVLQEILTIGVNDVRDSALARVDALPSDASPRRKIEAAMKGHLEGLLRHGGDFSSASIRVYGHLPPHLKKRNQEMRKGYGEFWDELFAAAEQAGEIRPGLSLGIVRLVAIGAINWTPEWFDATHGNYEDVSDQIVSMLGEGIFTSVSEDKALEGPESSAPETAVPESAAPETATRTEKKLRARKRVALPESEL